MKWYMVFAAYRGQEPGTVHGGYGRPPQVLVWSNGPVGVFRAPTPEKACLAAARKDGRAGTFFALEGFPWGLELEAVDDVDELGAGFAAAPREIEA